MFFFSLLSVPLGSTLFFLGRGPVWGDPQLMPFTGEIIKMRKNKNWRHPPIFQRVKPGGAEFVRSSEASPTNYTTLKAGIKAKMSFSRSHFFKISILPVLFTRRQTRGQKVHPAAMHSSQTKTFSKNRSDSSPEIDA